MLLVHIHPDLIFLANSQIPQDGFLLFRGSNYNWAHGDSENQLQSMYSTGLRCRGLWEVLLGRISPHKRLSSDFWVQTAHSEGRGWPLSVHAMRAPVDLFFQQVLACPVLLCPGAWAYKDYSEAYSLGTEASRSIGPPGLHRSRADLEDLPGGGDFQAGL